MIEQGAAEHGLGSTTDRAGNCQRRGGAGVRGVSRMDAAAKPPWTDLRRPRTSAPSRQPKESMLLLLLLLLQILRVQGAALPIPLPHWDVVRGTGIRFGLQGVVPPLLRVVHEATPRHRLQQLLAVCLLPLAQSARLRVRTWPEEVEVGTHVQRRAATAAAIQQPK